MCSAYFIQPGQQEVIWGKFLLPLILPINSFPSSRIVRSALNSVEKTLSKPNLLRAATSFPVTTEPGSRPNSSPIDTWMAGAVWTTTYFSGSARASQTRSISLTSVKAPTGQTTTHWPQLLQLISFCGKSKAVETTELKPRPVNSRAFSPCTSAQTLTQRPQRIHLLGSLFREGPTSSMGRSLFSPANFSISFLLIPIS